jgi:hypothetical protein
VNAHEKLGGGLSEYDTYTRARPIIDEFRELSESLELTDDESPPAAFVDAAKEAGTAIQRGLLIFPGSSELLAAKATFREYLDQTNREPIVLDERSI